MQNRSDTFVTEIEKAITKGDINKLSELRVINPEAYDATALEWLHNHQPGVDWRGTDDSMFTALTLATSCGAISVIEQWQTSQPESLNELKNPILRSSCPLLVVAVLFNQPKIVEWLLENGADVNWHPVSNPDITLIHLAAKFGSINAMIILKEKAPALLQRAINVQAKNANNSALAVAVAKNQGLAIEWLLENGADVNWHPVSNPNYTLIHLAANCRSINAMTILKEKAPALLQRAINLRCKNDVTPLSEAVRMNHGLAIEWLLENGADVNGHPASNPNYTLFHLAAKYGSINAMTILKEKAPALLQHAINLHDKDDNTPLSEAVFMNHRLAIEWLVENGADVNWHPVNYPNYTLIHYASYKDAVDALTTLKEKAPALFLRVINTHNRLNLDPLFTAASDNRTNAIAWILQYVRYLHATNLIRIIAATDDATESLQLLKNSNALRFDGESDEQGAFLTALQYKRHKTFAWLIANRSCQTNPHEIQQAATYFQNEFATLYQRKIESDHTELDQDQVQRDFRARFDLMLQYMHDCEALFLTMNAIPEIFKNCRKMAKQFGIITYSQNRVAEKKISLLEMTLIISCNDSENFHPDLLRTYIGDPLNLTWRRYVARIAAALDLKSEQNIEKVNSAITQRMSPYFIVADILAKRIHQEICQQWTGIAMNHLDDIHRIIIEFFMQNSASMEMAFPMLPPIEVTANRNYAPLPIDTLKAVVRAIVAVTEEQGHPHLNKKNIQSILLQYFLPANIVEQQANDKKRSAADLSSSHEDKRARSLSPSIFKNTVKREDRDVLPANKRPSNSSNTR